MGLVFTFRPSQPQEILGRLTAYYVVLCRELSGHKALFGSLLPNFS